MSAMATTRLDLPRAELVLLPVAPAVPAQRILSVEFRSSEWARESCPHGTTWEPVGWEDLYGE